MHKRGAHMKLWRPLILIPLVVVLAASPATPPSLLCGIAPQSTFAQERPDSLTPWFLVDGTTMRTVIDATAALPAYAAWFAEQPDLPAAGLVLGRGETVGVAISGAHGASFV